MVKSILLFSLAFFIATIPAFGQVSSQDLDNFRLIVKEEISKLEMELKTEIAKVETELKTEIAKVETELKTEISKSEQRMKDYVDNKFESIDKRINLVVGFVSALMVLIVITVGIPQVIISWRGKNERSQDKRIEELSREIEALKQQRIINP